MNDGNSPTTPAALAEAPVPQIAPDGALARYEAVYENLCTRIQSGELPLDSQLPGERELSTAYGVSRVTIRQALQKAERAGLITKIPGRGTFVSRRRVLGELGEMRPFRARIVGLDMVPSYSVASVSWTRDAPTEVTARLGVGDQARVLVVDCVGVATGRPMAQYLSYVPEHFGEKIAARVYEETRSTYELVADLLTLDQLRADQTFEAIKIDSTTATRLQVPAGSEGFRVSSLFSASEGSPVEYRIGVYPGGRYAFRISRIVSIQ